MYSKRQKLFKEQTYRETSPIEVDEEVHEERPRASSVASTTHIPTQRPSHRPPVIYAPKPTTKRMDGMVYHPIELGYRTKVISQRRLEDGYEQAQYETELRRTIPKKVEWQLMSDEVRKQMRHILSDDYKKALMKMAEPMNVTDTLKSQGETYLKPIAAQIDKTLRLTLLPDPVDIHLLDTELHKETDILENKLNIDLKLTAELSLKIDEKSLILAQKKEALEELKIKNKAAKEKLPRLEGSSFKEDPSDYIQMLFKYPSSQDY